MTDLENQKPSAAHLPVFSEQGVLVIGLTGLASYTGLLSWENYRINKDIEVAEQEMATLVADHNAAATTVSAFATSRDFITELNAQQQKINLLNDTNAVGEVGLTGLTCALAFGLTAGVVYNHIISRKHKNRFTP